jgi:hypothetical protein
MNNIKGLKFIVWMYIKRLIRECLKAIWKFLSKKRYIKDYKKKKAILMVVFLFIDCWIWNGLINDLRKTDFNDKIVVVNVSNDTMGSTAIANEPAVHDTSIGAEEQQDSIESVPLTVEDKICGAFPDNCELMIAIAKAESGLNAKAYNKNNNGSEDFGLFQINSIHGEDNLFDVDKNIAVAKKIYDNQGLNAWVAYQNNKYLQYL